MTARRLRWAAVSALIAIAEAAGAQVRVEVRDPGPGHLGRLVREALARPHVVVAGDTADLILPRDTVIPRGLVVIGRDLRIAANVRGDVVVIGGDVFLRPGARIAGDVIAAGGAVYDSFLATVGGARYSFRDETLVATLLPGGGYALDYRALRQRDFATFALPGIFGIRIPSYDRVNGLTLPVAPVLQLDSGRILLEPALTYRSHLGKIDPSVLATATLSRRTSADVLAGRLTRTNDEWIAGNLSNSLASIWSGRDKRNYYRADLLQARLHRLYERPSLEITPFVGVQWERAWSTGIQAPPEHIAYSFTQRTDTVEGMARPNPAVARGVVASALAGYAATWESEPAALELRSTGQVEVAPHAVDGGRFTQLTLDGRVTFPLVRNVTFRFDWHGVGTLGGAPPQRYAYLGGSGTLKTLDLLSQGGDQLVYTESRASMPIEQVRLPFVGSPTVTVRHMMGAAGVGGLPGLTHNLGLRVSLMLVRADLVVDPVSGATEFGFGVSLSQ